MKVGLRRGLADFACRILQATLPSSLRSWGWAVRCEIAGIPDDGKALLFALDSVCGLMPRAVASHLLQLFVSPIGDAGLDTGGPIAMNVYDAALRRPRALGVACAISAVVLGLAYMTIAGAPVRYAAINLAALVVGLASLALLGRATTTGQRWTGAAIVTMAGVLLATALVGNKVYGAARWVSFGGLSVQPSLILLPLMLVAFVRTRNALSTAGIIAAVVAIALQPDRAMAGMLALGLAIPTIMHPDRRTTSTFAVSVAGFTSTLVRTDTLPAVPYVDQILYSSFEVHAAAGMAVLCGSALLLVPAVVGWARDPANRATYATFGAAWSAAMVAAALGNYPTPIVGYGGSAIIGYALSLLVLPKLATRPKGIASPKRRPMGRAPTDRHMLAEMA